MNKLTDFNDMAKLSGLPAVKWAIDAAKFIKQKTDLVGSSPIDLNKYGNTNYPNLAYTATVDGKDRSRTLSY